MNKSVLIKPSQTCYSPTSVRSILLHYLGKILPKRKESSAIFIEIFTVTEKLQQAEIVNTSDLYYLITWLVCSLGLKALEELLIYIRYTEEVYSPDLL